MPVERPSSLDLGKLLRLHGMVNASVQTEAARDSAAALVRAYNGLVAELGDALVSDESAELADEFNRLFPQLDDPGTFSPSAYDHRETGASMATVALEARTRLGALGGWIQGLIDELTFAERMRLQAEADAHERAKLKPGFG